MRFYVIKNQYGFQVIQFACGNEFTLLFPTERLAIKAKELFDPSNGTDTNIYIEAVDIESPFELGIIAAFTIVLVVKTMDPNNKTCTFCPIDEYREWLKLA